MGGVDSQDMALREGFIVEVVGAKEPWNFLDRKRESVHKEALQGPCVSAVHVAIWNLYLWIQMQSVCTHLNRHPNEYLYGQCHRL